MAVSDRGTANGMDAAGMEGHSRLPSTHGGSTLSEDFVVPYHRHGQLDELEVEFNSFCINWL